MNTTAKHVAFNLVAAVAVITAASTVITHPLGAISTFVAAALVFIVVRDYRSPQPLPIAKGAVQPAARVYAEHRLAA